MPEASPQSVRMRSPLLERQIAPELLDELPATDPRAIRSRRDLRRVNALMGNARILARLLAGRAPSARGVLVEIGAGDGQLMLGLAKRLAGRIGQVQLTLVDQQNLLTPNTVCQFKRLGWSARAVQADVFDWLAATPPVDVIVANLFLHHFDNAELAQLLMQAATKTRIFAACEPRRFSFPALAGKLVWLIGCNSVTRHDAEISVRAGFAKDELSSRWPGSADWQLAEGDAGFFSHWFLARRT
jgi:hypothetical protein